jgi:hypothetical protein
MSLLEDEILASQLTQVLQDLSPVELHRLRSIITRSFTNEEMRRRAFNVVPGEPLHPEAGGDPESRPPVPRVVAGPSSLETAS